MVKAVKEKKKKIGKTLKWIKKASFFWILMAKL